MKVLKTCLLLAYLLFQINASAQRQYSMKAEGGFLLYFGHTLSVDPALGWRGYYLDEQNGIDINFIKSISYKGKLFAGLGLGYLNFEGVNGLSIFSDIEYLPLKTKFSPLFNLKVGFTHIWNQ